ncbi:MAG: hypothetical protein ACM3YN_08860 [Parcubacteria group bacterium]
MHYLFSIRPRYCAKIFEGSKTVELRRRFGSIGSANSWMFIYETAPTKAVAGIALIEKVERLAINDLWLTAKARACIDKADFDLYFDGVSEGVAIHLRSAVRLTRPLALPELTATYKTRAPQSYCTLSDEDALKMIAHGKLPPGYEHSDSDGGRAGDARGLRLAAA